MTQAEGKNGYVPNPHYSQEHWDEVDSPPLTDAQLAEFRPLSEAEPELFAAIKRTRGAQKAPTKDLVSLRIDRDILAKFRETGPGWQSRINDALKKL